MGTAPLSVRVVTQLAGGGAPPSNSCHRPRQLSGLPRRRGPYSNHLHPGGIRIFRIFHKQTKTSSYQEQCSWHWFGELAPTHAWGSRWGNRPAQGLPLCMQCLREIFLLSFDSETTFFWEDLCQRTTSFGEDLCQRGSHIHTSHSRQRNASKREGGAAAHA